MKYFIGKLGRFELKDLNDRNHGVNTFFFSDSYEIQLDSDSRCKGLGKFLMQILEIMAHRYVLNCILFTDGSAVIGSCCCRFPATLLLLLLLFITCSVGEANHNNNNNNNMVMIMIRYATTIVVMLMMMMTKMTKMIMVIS